MGGARTDAGTRGTSTLGAVLSESLFNQIFPRRNSFYTYASLIDAAKKFPSFASEGTQDQRKQELAAFFGNVARETGELRYIEQIAKDLYCSPGAYPCTPGQQYYGRGPLQISWNYNYGACGTALGLDLLNNPGLVASNPTVSWQTALWFWTQSNPTGVGTCHSAMLEGKGFGMTIRIINGGVECDGKATDAVQDRISHYQSYCAIFSVLAGSYLYY